MPKEAIEKFDRALAAWGGQYESESIRPITDGRYRIIPRTMSRKPERSFHKLTELLAATLKNK